jgi:hypothetical protein
MKHESSSTENPLGGYCNICPAVHHAIPACSPVQEAKQRNMSGNCGDGSDCSALGKGRVPMAAVPPARAQMIQDAGLTVGNLTFASK